jgi:predicted deacylase
LALACAGFQPTAILAHSPLEGPRSFHLGGFEVAAGQRADIRLDIAEGPGSPATFVPVTVLQGLSEGPVVLMVAGVHGYEFTPVLAAQRLADEIDPADLRGTLVIVRVAHVAAFEARSPYVNPNDRKNLNRSFPGSPEGSQSERIAHLLSSTLIPTADFVMDVHSGDGAEWLDAFIGVYSGPLSTDYDKALAVAEAFGFPNIVTYAMNTQAQVDRTRSLNRQAVAQGLPTVLVEIGENGSRDERHVEAIVTGVRRALSTLGVMEPQPAAPSVSPRYFEGTTSVPAAHSGIWEPVTRRGRDVTAGERLGEIRGYDGTILETVLAPVSGFALYGLAGPPVRQGDSVVTIATPAR